MHLQVIADEATRGAKLYGALASAHEGYAVMLEEFRELERYVFQKPSDRDLVAMKFEAMQLAAMCLRFITEVCETPLGNRR